ncbi:MAG: patatin-like phospholipase family protein [Lewinellaceae bacterium]|nr:patatin-like phospholipase family protein [Lewinellaceae bacterium]
MKKILYIPIVILSAGILLKLPCQAQKPYRVGVVLSGGGAKGYAHVGALKVLEEAGIRVDYIGGASMGAIIGGLYAAGWSAHELDSIVHTLDLTLLLQDKIPRDISPFFYKLFGEKYALSLTVEDTKINLPTALSDGQMAYNMLSRLTSRVATIDDFSQLPIPFFCTGTDVASGESILFEKGNLALSMRASGSFPGLLAPVEINNRLIADGGIVNNFPAKEMRAKGVDIVIGINVEADLLEKPELNSFQNIISQISSFQMTENSAMQYLYCDLLICPDIYGYNITSFDAVDTLESRGERAARQIWAALLEVAERQQAAPPLQHNPVPAQSQTWKIGSVEVLENQVFNRAKVLRNFSAKLPGEIEQEAFYKGIVNLYGTGNCRFVDYQFKKGGDNGCILSIQPRLKRGYDRSLRVGVHFDNVYKSSLLLNATILNLGFRNSITLFDVILGDQFRYGLYYYIDRGTKPSFGLNSRLHLNDVAFDLPSEITLPDSLELERLVYDLVDFSNELYVNLLNGSDFAVGFSGELKYYKFNTKQVSGQTGGAIIFDDNGLYLTATAFYKHDSRDKRYFATNGNLATLLARGIYQFPFSTKQESAGKLGYNVDLSYQTFFPLSKRLTASLAANAGISLGEKMAPYRYFLGGNNLNVINNFKPLIGMDFAQKAGTDLASASIILQYRILKNHYLKLNGNAAYLKQSIGEANVDVFSAGIGYGLDTSLGPIEVSYGVSTIGSALYFNLGYWF